MTPRQQIRESAQEIVANRIVDPPPPSLIEHMTDAIVGVMSESFPPDVPDDFWGREDLQIEEEQMRSIRKWIHSTVDVADLEAGHFGRN